jgi:glucan 1,3-beta-glucosidase
MRFSTFIPLALAAAPAVVSAAGSLGFALGDKKTDGSCKFQADWAADLKAISTVQSSKIPAAKAAGFKVILGVWYAIDETSRPLSQLTIQARLRRLPGEG